MFPINLPPAPPALVAQNFCGPDYGPDATQFGCRAPGPGPGEYSRILPDPSGNGGVIVRPDCPPLVLPPGQYPGISWPSGEGTGPRWAATRP